ncbi:MAG TPA: DUF1549 domain-containing protein [Gemmataceae bacterium]|nr:DUF1549 domain-containing protein [Gemmataceae bacterium]
MLPTAPPLRCAARCLLAVAILLLAGAAVEAGPNDKKTAKKPAPGPRTAILNIDAWTSVPVEPVKSSEIDALVLKELKATGVTPAPRTTGEQFLRRVTLDLTGELPLPADVSEFVADKDTNKRAKLIDKLLASDEFARHWSRYWSEVITSKLSDRRGIALSRSFEAWMSEQLKKDRSWGEIARAMITATGECHFDDDGKNGALFLILSRQGADAANERAAEVSRLFLGIQIQCAQCHDHPSDVWKREQFHELAGYFARTRERPARDGMRLVGFELVSAPRGEHQMPSKEDPRKGTITNPRFLDGRAPKEGLGDVERRRALASAVVAKENYWFAGAYVNRVWGELMGQSFYTPVDDLGPKKEAVFPAVLTRLAAAFRATDYDVKGMFRTITNSETYQRQIRLGESTDEHLHFAAAYPTRLRADVLWDSLTTVLGTMAPAAGPRPNPGPFAPRAFGLEGLFKDEFDFDPSARADEVESSIPQALLMMNNPAINQKIQARGTNLLGRILTAYPDDDDALRMVYLRALARKPTDREMDRCRTYVKKAGSRAEAFEDILWALLNSTEFQTKR